MDPLADLLGESAAIETVRERVRRLVGRQRGVPRRPPSILIQGETGTGKGLVARLIHKSGPRAGGPFVEVNCAAIPATLLEAELFGFERGAFTDARRAKPGLLQTANGGTIFLDEIGLLPEALQAKLLTAIEDQSIRRLGATASEPLNAWIICATNADLETAIAQRRFRDDLYHRLAVVTIDLPPLRRRGRDVLLLAERFLARSCADYGLPPKALTEDARRRLLTHRWPGNIRELSNVIERAALLEDARLVTAETLALESDATTPAVPPQPAPATPPLDQSMREHLLAVLGQTGWNISRAAGVLGIARNTLRARIEKFGLRAAGRPAPTRPSEMPPPVPLAMAATGPVPAPIRWEYRRITLLRVALSVLGEMDFGLEAGRALGVLLDKARLFGGRIEELSPMGIVASFGLDPIEDAPRRAVHAAMAIRKVGERAQRRGETFRTRAAIHVSRVLVARSGDTRRIDADAKLDHWRTLDVLLAASATDDTVISTAAAPFLERRFDLSPTGLASGGGREVAYRVGGPEKSGLELWGQMGRFVGRRDELELLANRRASALAMRGQLVALAGEPGVGKSRLVWEFVHQDASSGIRQLEARALSYGKTAPYLPVIELLKTYFGIDAHDENQRIVEKVMGRLAQLGRDPSALPALLGLLDVAVDDPEWRRLDPAVRRHRTLDALRQLLVMESRARPLLLVFEDLHWIDTETQALLDMVVDILPTLPILLLVTYRTEYQHDWGAKSFYTQLPVNPLPPENANELLDALLGVDPGLAPVKSLLIDWTEGNPFFLEEGSRILVETGVLGGQRGAYQLEKPVTSVQVPATVEEVLAARIDRLDPDDKQHLQSAAVIGKDFSLALLQAIVERPEDELQRSLARLRAAEFLYEAGTFPKLEYTFRHAVTHEVTYRGMLADRRRALHGRIVAAIERLYPERLEEHTERLAHHATQSERWGAALRYLRQAGTKAATRSAHREAVAHFEEALAALERLPQDRESSAESIDVRFDLRTSLLPLGEFARIFEHLREAEVAAQTLNDARRLGRVSAFLADYFRQIGDYDRGRETGRRGLEIAEALGDLSLRVATHMYLGHNHHDLGEYRRASELFRANVELLRGEPPGERLGLPYVPSIHSRHWLVLCQAELGTFEEGIAWAEEGLRMAEAVDHVPSLIATCDGFGLLLLRKGDAARAIPILERGLELSRVWNIRLWLAVLAERLGGALALCGRLSAALPMLEEAVERHASMRGTAGQSHRLTSLGEGYLLADRLDDAARVALRAIDLARRHGERGNEAYGVWLTAESAARRHPGDRVTAEAGFRHALMLGDELGMRPLAARCQLGLGRLYRASHDRTAAAERLHDAATRFGQMDMALYLEQAEMELKLL